MKVLCPVRKVADLGLLLVLSLISAFGQVALVEDTPGGAVYVADEVLVQFKARATDAELRDATTRGQLGALLKQIQTPAMKAHGQQGISRLWTRIPVRQAVQALRNHPTVEFAEPNWIYEHQDLSNDPLFLNGDLWGMYGDLSSPANQYGSQAAEAWAAGSTGSSSVVVGVIDEGMQFTHPDLGANIWSNPFDAADGSDNDGNGYKDDIHGWNFFGNNNSIYDATGDDHGTHVAGTIGAVGKNGIGVVGVNWAVTIISGKFLGPNGGSTADAIEAVDYFTHLKTQHSLNIVALNNSWGGGGYSQGLHDAIIRAAKANILFVAAAGNGNKAGKAVNNDSTPSYPSSYNTATGTTTETAAGYDGVIAVTAIDNNGKKATWANYGANSVDLGAPGVNINSTLPTDSYGAYSGTSMATPHVTGAVALYASTHPGASAVSIKSAILGATKPTASLAGITVTGGRLDLSTVIGSVTPSDNPPSVSIASPGNGTTVAGQVTVTANASDDHGVAQVEFFIDNVSIGIDTDGNNGWAASWNTTLASEGSHNLTAIATDSINQTGGSSPVAVTVQNQVDTSTHHCGDLDAVVSNQGAKWTATVTVTVHDAFHSLLSGSQVTGTWSGGYTGSASGSVVNGKVSLLSGPIAKNVSSVTFTISNIAGPSGTYNAAANHDPESDSNGTTITINR